MGALDGKVCVVTGASRGIGEAIAIGYANEGAHVVLAARSQDDLQRVAGLCGDGAMVIPTDVGDQAQVDALVDKTVAEFGALDVFVANAGTSYGMLTDKTYKELHTYDLEIVEQIFRVNAIGAWLCLRAAIPAMKPGGSFIFVGSSTARAGRPTSGIYPVSKGAIDTMTKIAGGELVEAGIRVNNLMPGGMVDTTLFGPNKMPEHLKRFGALEPSAIVPAAVWLASDDSEGITAQEIVSRAFDERGAEAIKAELLEAQRAAAEAAAAHRR